MRPVVLAYNTSLYVWKFRMPLLEALRERGYEVVVLAPRDGCTERIVAAGFGFRELRLEPRGRNPAADIGTFLDFIRAYRELHPSVALHYTIKPNLYGSLAARMLAIPAIDNVTGLGAIFERDGLLQRCVGLAYRVALARVSRVFFQNTDDRDLFVGHRFVDPARVEVLPGSGVDLERFRPAPRPDGPFTFLFVGRLLKAKGVEDLVAAARIVRSRVPEVRIVLLGERADGEPGAADPAILDAAISDGTVIAPGATDDVRPFLTAADCVVLPSYYREGVPRSLLEAIASGKPVIAADSVGTREPVIEGENGFLCRPRDPADLAAVMSRMAELAPAERAALGEASRKLAETRFDERIVIGKYLEAVDAATASGPAT
ncbi:MAG: glycosyltransferase family 4 protein [Spirochaetes bacterium]|nr:glycosyltransferase family 4 protein [Spirochaetota bacterium]